MTRERRQLLRIDAPEWYQRADFLAWLNAAGRASWHTPGTEAGEYADVFITYDHGEGSDLDELMPEDVWQAITEAARAEGLDDCLVWIANVGEA